MNRRTLPIILAVAAAVVALAVAILGNLVSDDLRARVQPYMGWVYGALTLLFVLSVILLVWQMRLSDDGSSTRIKVAAKNGGKIEQTDVRTPSTDVVDVSLTADGKGSTLKETTVEVGKTEHT